MADSLNYDIMCRIRDIVGSDVKINITESELDYIRSCVGIYRDIAVNKAVIELLVQYNSEPALQKSLELMVSMMEKTAARAEKQSKLLNTNKYYDKFMYQPAATVTTAPDIGTVGNLELMGKSFDHDLLKIEIEQQKSIIKNSKKKLGFFASDKAKNSLKDKEENLKQLQLVYQQLATKPKYEYDKLAQQAGQQVNFDTTGTNNTAFGYQALQGMANAGQVDYQNADNYQNVYGGLVGGLGSAGAGAGAAYAASLGQQDIHIVPKTEAPIPAPSVMAQDVGPRKMRDEA